MRVLALAAVMFLASCSLFMKSIEKPKAEVRGVSMTAAGLSGVEGELRLDVQNPNSFGVPLAGIDWQLAVGGAQAVTGKVELQQTIPAKGIAPIATSLRVDARDALAVAGALARGQRAYTLRATLHFSTQFGPLAIDVQHTGQLGGAGGLGVGSILGAR